MIKRNEHIIPYVDDLLFDLLSPREAKIGREHCDDCRICQVALEEAEKRQQAFAASPTLEASERLVTRTVERVQQHRGLPEISPKRIFWYGAAAAALLIASLNVYYATLSPSPYDLHVLGQAELLAGSHASLRVWLADHRTGAAVPDARVEISLADSDRGKAVTLASFNTDADGSASPRFELPEWDNGDYELVVRSWPNGRPEVLTRTVKLRRSWQLMLSTDKPVYQPGQVIHIRNLGLRRPDLEPIAGHDVEFSVTDPKGNVIFRRRDVTSKFGIASAECPLATEIIEGAYEVQSQVGDTVSRATVEVKPYVLPKFKVDVKLDRSYYEAGGLVRGTVRANYFFSKPVAGGQVRIRAENLAAVRPLEVEMDADGNVDFEIRLPHALVGREPHFGDVEMRLLVTVQDTAGQEQKTHVSRIVTINPIRIEVIPEAGTLVPSIANRVYLYTSYPDGRPASARLAVSGQNEELQTNSLGVAVLEITPTSGTTDLVLRATDSEGRVGRREISLSTGRPAEDFLVRTDKAVYDGGDTVVLTALGGGSEPVFIDLLKDGQTMLTRTVAVTDGRGQAEFDLPPELFGTLQMCAYRFDESGLPVRKTRVLYVRQARGLKIDAQLDRSEYRPGDQARLQLTLTDKDGTPTPGAVSLSVVDEAVFSVHGAAPGMEGVFFALEKELLEPVYAIYPWSPDDVPGDQPDEQIELEQAMFARTTREQGNRDAILKHLIDEYMEGWDGVLEVLERPDWEELAAGMGMSDEVIALLRNDRSPHSLSATTYPAKERQVAVRRRNGLEAMKVAWGIFGVVAFLGLIVSAMSTNRAAVVIGMIVVMLLLAALMLPALNSVRESARRSLASANLRQIDLAVQMAKDRDDLGPLLEMDDQQAAGPVRVREWFPETLLWRPELITDDKGRATIEVDLADSITTWRMSASAVTAQGQLGSEQSAIRVFQPFFVDVDLPVSLTRGDEVAVPVVVYNYLEEDQTVRLKLDTAPWFESLDDQEKTVDLAAGAVRSVYYRIRVKDAGEHRLQVTARGKQLTDAIRRPVTVVPDGRRVEQVFNGNLQQPATIDVDVPEDAIPGSVKAIVKLYPSGFSQLVEGLDAIFQRPYGCFEQASSTTYPNVLALDYLRRTDKSVPAVEAKARQYIHLGYQRLLSFEVNGGGFDWFGNPPANRTLTAYGLMEFQDMAQVHDVDPQIIQRTRRWLLEQQQSDVSWMPEGHRLHDDPTHGRSGELARLSTTAYIAWAVFDSGPDVAGAESTLRFLRSYRPKDIPSPYVLALVANAMLAIDPSGAEAADYLDRLKAVKQTSADGKLAWWGQSLDERTVFYGSGRSGEIETTATAALALLRGKRHATTVRNALTWLVTRRDSRGTWHTTQGTVLALKALIRGTGKALGGESDRRVELAVSGDPLPLITIPAIESDVVKQIDLTDRIAQGKHQIRLAEQTDTAPAYQVTLRYHVPDADRSDPERPLSIELAYDKTDLTVNDTVVVNATVTNNTNGAIPMVIADLPIPAGFRPDRIDFAQLVEDETIAKYQITPRSVIVYLRQLAPQAELTLRYTLQATMPVRITSPAAWAYEYYDPDRKAASSPVRLTVAESGG